MIDDSIRANIGLQVVLRLRSGATVGGRLLSVHDGVAIVDDNIETHNVVVAEVAVLSRVIEPPAIPLRRESR